MTAAPDNSNTSYGRLRSHLGRARGLGSAKTGLHHWLMQRVTALANIPLVIWAVYSFMSHLGADHATFTAFVAQPLNSVLLILFVISTFYHAALGLQVVIEDYIHGKAANLACLLLVKLGLFALAAATILSILRIAYGA